jgi:hypothetical protein
MVARSTDVDGRWEDLESFVAISQDDDARRIFLRMAALSHAGRLTGFIDEIARDADLDEETKGQLAELAQDDGFLLAVEDFLVRTTRFH